MLCCAVPVACSSPPLGMASKALRRVQQREHAMIVQRVALLEVGDGELVLAAALRPCHREVEPLRVAYCVQILQAPSL